MRKKMQETICVSVAIFGMGLICVGLMEIYKPLAYIYGGAALIFLANIAVKKV